MRMKGFAGRLTLVPFVALAILVLAGAAPPRAVAEEVSAVGPVTSLPMPRFVSIRADMANARRGPGRSYRIDWTFVRRGLPVQVTAEHGNWRRVEDSDGESGWIHHSLLSGVRTGLVQGEGELPLLAKPEASAKVSARVEPGVVVRIRECSGDWCRVSVDNVGGWITQSALWGVRAGEIVD